MNSVLDRARTVLLSRGLHAEEYNASCLNVWATDAASRTGLKLTHDLSRLYAGGARLTIQFPGPGQCRYEIAGDPDDILEKVVAVYARYREEGGTLDEAVAKTIDDSQRYLTVLSGR
jgi:hypothetical protein